MTRIENDGKARFPAMRNALLVIMSASIILFYPIAGTYGYTDVYEFLYHAGNKNFIHVFIQGGRPVYGLINKFLLTGISSVEQLTWLRCFGVAGLVLAALTFLFMLNRFFINGVLALLCVLFFLATPSANITGIWVGTYQVGWALAMALLGGYLALTGLTNAGIKNRWLLISGGALLGLLALLTYQPCFTAFIIPGLLYFLKGTDHKKVIAFLAFYFSLYGVYYILHNLILNLTGLQPLSRTGLTTDPIGKVVWFFRWPLKMAYQDNFLFYPAGYQKLIAVLFLLLTLTAVFYLIRGKNTRAIMLSLLILIVLLFSTYVPNLLSSDNYVSYRTLSTIFMFKLVLVFYALTQFQKRYRFTRIAVSVFGIILFANSWYNVNQGFASSQAEEYALIRTEVNRLLPEMKEKNQLVFIMPDFEFLVKQGRVRRVVSDEFGSLSSSRNWVPMPMVKQILREQGESELEKRLEVFSISSAERVTLEQHSGKPVLDVEALYIEHNRHNTSGKK